MFIVEDSKITDLTQKEYKYIIKHFIGSNIKCPKCKNILKYHSQTERTFIYKNKKIKLNLYVMKCIECKKSHVILMDKMIPYCSYSIDDVVDILLKYYEGYKISEILSFYLYYDENTIHRIIYKYEKIWNKKISIQELKSPYLLDICYKKYGKQFFQVKYISDTYLYNIQQEKWICRSMSDKIEP